MLVSLSSLIARARQRLLMFAVDVCVTCERLMSLDDAEYLGLMIDVASVLLVSCFALAHCATSHP